MKTSCSKRFYDVLFDNSLVVIQTKEYITRTEYKESLVVDGKVIRQIHVTSSGTVYLEA
ncbi:hypothetical protein PLEI_1443 [Photobacterium leiognathi lrivu.4.1]|uniref:Uncharacterized protein n=1 Tax=Photobacterium leiognathi lrivu.4.1 TaxID=1248232 RepID=A0A0U1P5F1_PHOLE|nr:hypothetical protein PLEI_1443 [Photobacterium leiognathi lrivu.4.1]